MVTAAEDRDRRRPKIRSGRKAAAKRPRSGHGEGQRGAASLVLFSTAHFREEAVEFDAPRRRNQRRRRPKVEGRYRRRPKARSAAQRPRRRK